MKNKFGKASYYKDGSVYICEINYKDHIFIGRTICYPSDRTYESENTGYTIAESRAEIQRLCFVRDEVNAELRAMKRLRSTARIVKGSNLEKHLNEEITSLSYRLDLISETIQDIKNSIKHYIEDKDRLYRQWDKANKTGKEG